MVVEDQSGTLREVELLGQCKGHRHRRDGELRETAEHAKAGNTVARRETRVGRSGADQAGDLAPGTKGRSGFIWYSPRDCRTSGNETPAALTSITTPSPGVIT